MYDSNEANRVRFQLRRWQKEFCEKKVGRSWTRRRNDFREPHHHSSSAQLEACLAAERASERAGEEISSQRCNICLLVAWRPADSIVATIQLRRGRDSAPIVRRR